MSDPLFLSYLTAPWKKKYVKQKKDPNQCIFCAIAQKTPGIEAWEVFRDDRIMVLLNRFPYNPGHLLIAPIEHYNIFEEIPSKLIFHLTIMLQRGIKLLKHTHQPTAFNIGLNLGKIAGGSMDHIHWHIVPRYSGDLNFMEILRTRVLIETLNQTLIKLRQKNSIFQIE
ncbi:MAG: HIT family protein [Candidatus Thorarchaeota archaeon]